MSPPSVDLSSPVVSPVAASFTLPENLPLIGASGITVEAKALKSIPDTVSLIDSTGAAPVASMRMSPLYVPP